MDRRQGRGPLVRDWRTLVPWWSRRPRSPGPTTGRRGRAAVSGTRSLRPAGRTDTLPARRVDRGRARPTPRPSSRSTWPSSPGTRRPCDAFVAAVSTPGSPQYHHYLAAGQFAADLRPDPGHHRRHPGLAGLVGAAGRDAPRPTASSFPVSGSTAEIEQAFDVSLVSARLPDGRVARFAQQRPAVPSALASSVVGVVGLSTVGRPATATGRGPDRGLDGDGRSTGSIRTPCPRPMPGPDRPAPERPISQPNRRLHGQPAGLDLRVELAVRRTG